MAPSRGLISGMERKIPALSRGGSEMAPSRGRFRSVGRWEWAPGGAVRDKRTLDEVQEEYIDVCISEEGNHYGVNYSSGETYDGEDLRGLFECFIRSGQADEWERRAMEQKEGGYELDRKKCVGQKKPKKKAKSRQKYHKTEERGRKVRENRDERTSEKKNVKAKGSVGEIRRERESKKDEERVRQKCKEVEKERRDEFRRLKRFVGDRMRMCRLVRLGKRQRFVDAIDVIGKEIKSLYDKKERNEREERMRQRARAWKDERRRMWADVLERCRKKSTSFEEAMKKHGQDVYVVGSDREEELAEEELGDFWQDWRWSFRQKIESVESRAEWVMSRRRDLQIELGRIVDKNEIRNMIEESIVVENCEEPLWGVRRMLEGRGVKKEKVNVRKKRDSRGDGQIWLLARGGLQEILWRREQRRRELMERWEAPPPGPPGFELRKGRGSSDEDMSDRKRKSSRPWRVSEDGKDSRVTQA